MALMSSTVNLQLNGPKITVITNMCKPPTSKLCTCRGFVMEELHPKNFLFEYLFPEDFIKFQCIKSVFKYLVWRSVWAIIFLFMLILNGTISDYWNHSKFEHYEWFTYLTHWASYLLAGSTTIDVICVIHIYLYKPDIVKEESRHMPWFLKINWLIWTISNNIIILITFIHWIFIYEGERISIFTLTTYCGTAIYIISNLVLVASPVRLYHIIYPLVITTLYAACNFVYQQHNLPSNSKHMKTYPGWKSYYDIINTDIIFVGLSGCVHIVFYLVYIIRLFISRYWCVSSRTSIYWHPDDCGGGGGGGSRQDIRYTFLTTS